MSKEAWRNDSLSRRLPFGFYSEGQRNSTGLQERLYKNKRRGENKKWTSQRGPTKNKTLELVRRETPKRRGKDINSISFEGKNHIFNFRGKEHRTKIQHITKGERLILLCHDTPLPVYGVKGNYG